jgi:formamidopyrimidine-DNA glycosylase
MPELPEVETIRRGLEKYVVGQQIADINILSSKQFFGDPKIVIGAEIIGVRRFGKGLIIDLSNDFSIAIHVKMTGNLFYDAGPVRRSPDAHANKHTRVIFKLKSKNSKSWDSYLYYNDIRKFGWIRVVETKKVMDLPFFKSLGPEPLRDLDLPLFRDILSSTTAPIKSVLMDQHKISGIGNIYANEALFLAKIYPLRLASSLHQGEARRLLGAIEEVLRKSITIGGASMANYVNLFGKKGAYQENFLVYKREGEKCSFCKNLIEKIKIGGRGTFYCPKCQREVS